MEKIPRYQNQFFFILLGISFVLAFFILRPFLISLLVAIAFATVLHPVYRFIQKPFGRWTGIPAFLTILLTMIVVIAPVSFIASRIITESRSAYGAIGSELAQSDSFLHQIEDPIRQFIPDFRLNVDAVVRPLLQMLSDRAGSIFATTVTTIINTVIFFIGLFFLLKNGNEIKRWMIQISPLPNAYDGVIIHRLEATITSVIRGSLFIAIVQGIIAGIGYMIFGVPNPTLLGFLTAIASLIPGLGTPIITIPSALYLYFTGNQIGGIGMAIWGFTAVSLIDNLLGPFIIGQGKGVNIHPFLILISVLGGLAFFGPWGFILGPLAISFLLALLDVFAEYIEQKNLETTVVEEKIPPNPHHHRPFKRLAKK